MKHTMVFVGEHEGTEEWLCPTCGRNFLIDADALTIKEEGDRYASHSGSTGGLQIVGVQTGQ